MSWELNKRKKAFEESVSNFKVTLATHSQLEKMVYSLKKDRLLRKAKKQLDIDLSIMVKRRGVLTTFCERTLVPIPEDSLKAMEKYASLIEQYEIEHKTKAPNDHLYVRTRCCFKRRLAGKCTYRSGVGKGGYYCNKGHGCNRSPSSERPEVDTSLKVWRCECGNENYKEVQNVEIHKFGMTTCTIVSCTQCKKQDKIFLKKYNK